ncbi:MAG: FtsQ-type POTRA domain-containing protein [bacterium]|nr:FtsQ-type POTRA domain-containing protein [bacterium]
MSGRLLRRLLRRRGNRHRPGRHERGGAAALPPTVTRVLRTVVPLALLAAVTPAALEAARAHSYFAVHEVALQHRGRLAPEALREAVAIAPGTSIWDVDREAIVARVQALPWVRTVRVRRQLPDRVVVRVREHRPAAIVALDGDAVELFYVAANGRIFAAVGGTDGRDLPYVTGIRRDDLDGRRGFGPRAVHRALGLLRLVARDATGLGPVSEVHVDAATGLTLHPMQPAVPIVLGWGGYGEKIARVQRVLPLWQGRFAELREVTCEFEDEVIVRLREPRKPAAPARTTGA